MTMFFKMMFNQDAFSENIDNTNSALPKSGYPKVSFLEP